MTHYLFRILFALVMSFLTIVSWVHAEGMLKDYWTYQEFQAQVAGETQNAARLSESVRLPAGRPTKPIDRVVSIVIIYPGKQASDYWRRSVSSFEARLRETAILYKIKTYFSKPSVDVRLQAQQMAEALKGDPDYLIFTLDALRHRHIIERIKAKGRPKVILQNITTPVKDWSHSQPFLYVGFDHGEGSRILADQYIRQFGKTANYAILYGPAGYVSTMRGGTFKKILSSTPDMNLTAEYYVGFNRVNAYKATMEMLDRQLDLDFIYACSTDIALGVIDALKETGNIGKIKVNGWGGGSSELDAIEAGHMDMTVMRMNDDNGVAMADAILMDLNNDHRIPVVYSGDMQLVTKAMGQAEIDRLKTQAFRYSDKWEINIEGVLTNIKE